ncbi:MAG TPA: adenylosuccinate synthase [Cyanobacteria bacterium UBA8530]|nr:adenylosuccinate synthase [Cyanobacteria bacterium UBA8530]
MSAVRVLVGAQWGDEGKGKITDLLALESDLVVRFQGGGNAGHTVFKGDVPLKLHNIPSGILHRGTLCALGNGMVIDPGALLKEKKMLEENGVDTSGLRISGLAHLILPTHRLLDRALEGQRAIGTTGNGIGPAYTDKSARLGLRLLDFKHPEVFKEKLSKLLDYHNALLTKVFGLPPVDVEEIAETLLVQGSQLLPHLEDVSLLIDRFLAQGKSILFEGAQGALLDLDFGTYPFVTSSSTLAGGACSGAGIAPSRLGEVIGVCKAYSTRVGEGPFPTELLDERGIFLREKGREYGTTTGRPRRCGWLDLVALRYAVRLDGIDSLAITKLDVLDSLSEIPFAVAYRLKGEILGDFPVDPLELAQVEPVYETMPGWECDTSGARSFEELPRAARAYLDRISKILGVSISLVSIGPKREETFFVAAGVPVV